MNFKQYLQESFDSKPAPLRFQQKQTYPNNRKYIKNAVAAFTVGGNVYGVFARHGVHRLTKKQVTSITFTLNGSDALTDTGNQYKVLVTVIEFVRWLIENYENDTLMIGAKNERGQDDAEGYKTSKSRAKVYERLIRKFIRPYTDWRFRETIKHNETTFFILNKKDELDDLMELD